MFTEWVIMFQWTSHLTLTDAVSSFLVLTQPHLKTPCGHGKYEQEQVKTVKHIIKNQQDSEETFMEPRKKIWNDNGH